MADRESVIVDCAIMRQVLSDTTTLDAELDSLNEEITVVAELVKTCVRENASTAQSQEEYAKKYNGLLARYEKATARLAEVAAEKERKRNQDREIRLFIEALKKQPLVLEEWDERLWIAIVDRATVFRDGRIVFKFKCGSEIEVER
jgi:chromosome segregation ATPase